MASRGSILVLPGGGYGKLAPHEGEPIAHWLRSIGWDARAVDYPVATLHPAPLEFLQQQIAAERRTADVVGVLGFSAGGHLAGLSALASDAPADARPDFAVLGYPVVSMVTATHSGSRRNLLGARARRRLRRATSLELLVTSQSPPMFLWTTAEDETVPPVEHTYPLAAALARNGVPHEVHVFEHGKHGLGLAEGVPAEAWTDLCERWLAARR